ncbi:hypothetical protein B7494_g3487 [Chlorociboria aeruginascens]|nr:hypothetical protein B7494_g3487 [Chlorociboria aeruginascens]
MQDFQDIFDNDTANEVELARYCGDSKGRPTSRTLHPSPALSGSSLDNFDITGAQLHDAHELPLSTVPSPQAVNPLTEGPEPKNVLVDLLDIAGTVDPHLTILVCEVRPTLLSKWPRATCQDGTLVSTADSADKLSTKKMDFHEMNDAISWS